MGPDKNPTLRAGSEAVIEPAPQQFGTPRIDSVFWQGQQGYPDTCAIRCQEFILDQFKGRTVNETDLVHQAINHGWYAPGSGTQMQNVGNLLELNGIPVHRYHNATVFHLANELAQGHKVIVGVDSGDLWRQHPILHAIEEKLGIAGADHAVVVSGIDTSNPEAVRVVVSDPGTGQEAASYPLDQFISAWKGSSFFMVATNEPAPHWLAEMVNFDYAQGHIDKIWGMPYDDFLHLADHPESWGAALEHASNVSRDEVPSLQNSLFQDFQTNFHETHDPPCVHHSLFGEERSGDCNEHHTDSTYHDVDV